MSSMIVVACVGVLLLGALVLGERAPRPDEDAGESVINLGTPSDTGGLLGNELDGIVLPGGRQVVAYPLKDCCTTKTEYALSVDLLDAALLCPDAAERLIEKDGRYVNAGPVLMNSELLVDDGSGEVRTVAVGIGRPHQAELAREAWGEQAQVRPALASVVPFAFADGEVDAAVVDFLDARALDGRRIGTSALGADVVTYELVVRRDLMESGAYADLVERFASAAETLNTSTAFSEAVREWTGQALTEEEVDLWTDSKMRFVSPGR